MTVATTSLQLHRLSRPAASLYDGLTTVGRHVSLYAKVLISLPYALIRYRKHTLGQVGEVTFGTKSLLSGGGTIGIVFAMSLAAAMMLGVETQRGLDLVGMQTLSGTKTPTSCCTAR